MDFFTFNLENVVFEMELNILSIHTWHGIDWVHDIDGILTIKYIFNVFSHAMLFA